jgi:hypothetical protein
LLNQSSINLSHLISSQNERDRQSFILTKPCIPTKNLEIRIKKVLQTNTTKNLVELLLKKLTIINTYMVHDMFDMLIIDSHDLIFELYTTQATIEHEFTMESKVQISQN